MSLRCPQVCATGRLERSLQCVAVMILRLAARRTTLVPHEWTLCYSNLIVLSQQKQLNMRGFDNIETLKGGEDECKIGCGRSRRQAVSGMIGDLAELLNAFETGGVGNAEEILEDDASVDANRECASRKTKKCTVCWRGTRALRR